MKIKEILGPRIFEVELSYNEVGLIYKCLGRSTDSHFTGCGRLYMEFGKMLDEEEDR